MPKDNVLRSEEVPRWGVVVSSAFQYGRTADGRGVLWMGRRKRAGRGKRSSGLRFDVAERPSLGSGDQYCVGGAERAP